MSISLLTKISDKITMIHLSDSDSNIYLIGKDMLIDTGTGFNFVRLMDIFRRLNMDFENIKTIVNTHSHFDHIGGNGFFPGAKIFVHEYDAPVLEKGDKEKSIADFFNGNIKKYVVEKKLKEGDMINWLKVIHTPGHTPGSICLFKEDEKMLLTGDTVFADGVGRTDLPGGNEEDLFRSIERLKKMKIEKILPGHGEPVLKNGLKVINALSEYADHE